MNAKTLHVTVNKDTKTVYEFIFDVHNLPKWAKGLGDSVKKSNGGWVVQTPKGPAGIRFVEPNPFGIADHYVSPSPGVEIYVPVRVVPNGPGSEVLFTLFQRPEMTDEQYAQDMQLVEQDLAALKRVLET